MEKPATGFNNFHQINKHVLKKLITRLLLVIVVLIVNFAAANAGPLFKQAPGVVSYTYRNYFEKDVPSTLDMIKRAGFTDIEFSNLFGKTAKDLRKMLDDRGLKCSSFGVSYDDLLNKTQVVAENAKTLGAEFVRVATIPHKGAITLVEMQTAIEFFNTVGKILKEQFDLTFIYHNHGFEFEPYNGGTLYDYLITQTNPKYVSFELDILWAFFPGQNPAELLKKYGKRFKTLHLKDLKKGVKGNMSGTTSKENDVVLGTGQIDIPSVLKAAKKAKIKHYYIEDESNNVLEQVPQSIAYLKSLRK
ncbi:MAG: sugar phosphate isomerase/epimerase [Segetibacter sp.]|nr:sugar phosphate isomerase/epimerase [Segetibacter sp.]